MPPGFNNRLAANWRLLFAVADHAGSDWPKRARRRPQLSRKPPEPSAGGQVARKRCAYCGRKGGNREVIASAAIVGRLTADPDSEWREYKGRGPITQRQVAGLLKNYKIYPRTIHPTGRADDSPRGYQWADFDDAFARFLPTDPHIHTSRTAEISAQGSVRMCGSATAQCDGVEQWFSGQIRMRRCPTE